MVSVDFEQAIHAALAVVLPETKVIICDFLRCYYY